MSNKEDSSNSVKNSSNLWSSRFSSGPSEALARISKSTHFDWQLAPYDIKGSCAHANALHQAGYLSDSEFGAINNALEQILADFYDRTILPLDTDEDVHSTLERILIDIVGPEIGGKIRAGRSRNDQIATFIRMYMRDEARSILNQIFDFLEVIVAQAKENIDAIMPGRTHLQHAQPVLLAHHLLAHAWPMLRNVERINQWYKRAGRSPYGGGALAGNTLGLDPVLVASDLGMDKPCDNSIDGTSARDLVAEFSYILTQVGIDLSRFAEEIIIWATKEFDFIKLDDAYSTGSSIMPQKKNPDIAELVRGKSGRLIGNLSGLLATFKALPLAYNRDLQEDKEPLFDSVETVKISLPAFTGMLATLKFNTERMRSLAPEGFSLATDAAEWLVRQGVSFKESHEISGKMVKFCEERNIELSDLQDAQLAEISPFLNLNIKPHLNIDAAILARNGFGGTATTEVVRQFGVIEQQIKTLRISL